MSGIFNVYCDESCHLENDHQQVMVLGALWCPLGKVREIIKRLREIKKRHNKNVNSEIKWSKVAPANRQFYLDVMDYFFDDDDLHFRALIVLDKSQLHYHAASPSHDDWYYRMYFDMLKAIINPDAAYRIYIDIKDTVGAKKIRNLHEVLCGNMEDNARQIIEWMQLVRSHEVDIMQVTDLLIGTISYANRGLSTSEAKQDLVSRMRERSGYKLTKSTLPLESKVNLLVWQPSKTES
jgi:hypothetical protein